MFLTLWNVYRFHADYAALDAFDPETSQSSVENRSRLDRWIFPNSIPLQRLTMKALPTGTSTRLADNLRISSSTIYPIGTFDGRRRLWTAESGDKLACQHTLHEVLTTLCRLIAPVSPFMVDTIHRNLTGQTVHTASWPMGTPGSTEGATADAERGSCCMTALLPPHDVALEHEMELVRELAETDEEFVSMRNDVNVYHAEGWIAPTRTMTCCGELNVKAFG